jgi:autotransporter-associated beta strand protein
MKNQVPTPESNLCRYFAGLKRHKIIALVLTVAGLASSVWAGAGTWTGTTSTDWNTAGNWSGGVPSGGNATIDLVAGNICTLTANASATPVDIRIGEAAGLTGRVDHRAGTLSTGSGNWFFAGINTGTGYYNLANTASAGSGLTGFAQGSGSLSASIIWVGGAWYNDNGIGTVKINTTGTVSAYNTGWVSICAGESWNGGTGIGEIDLESGTVNAAGELWLGVDNAAGSGTASGTLKMTGGTLNVNTGNDGNPNYVGYNNGNGTMIVTNGTANFTDELRVGGSDTSGTGFNAAGTLSTYGGNVNVSSLTLARGNNNQNGCNGTINVNGGILTSTNDVVSGFAGTGTGTININGGTFNVGTANTKWLQLGVWDTTVSVINVTNGNLNLNTGTSIKFDLQNSSGAHTINQYGGNVTFYSDFATTVGGGGAVDLRYASGSTGANTYNLNGGTLTVPQIIASQATGTRAFNFNGGTLKAAAASSSFFASGVASAATVNSNSTIDNNGKAITIGQVLAGSGGLTFADSGAAAVTTLTGAETYTGNTTISGGTLALSGSGSLASTNLTVSSGATLDVSVISFTLGGTQNLLGSGTVNGAVNTTSGSQIYPATDGTAGTLTFNNNLTMVSGATFNLDVSASSSSGNDKVIVGGTLALNSTVFNLKGPATLATSDYTLATAASITGTPTVNWVGTAPGNAASFTFVNDGTTIKLHYAASPTLTASASPASLLRNQATTITAAVTPGTIGNVASVSVDLTPIGGVSNASLVYSNTVGGNQIWTNTFAVSAGTSPGAKILNLTAANDSTPTPYTGTAATSVTVNTSAETWDGSAANDNFTSNLNWLSGYAPGYTGDSITFAGTARPTPSMDTNYSVSGVTFDSSAGSFTIGTGNGSALTITANGVVNNSANPQTVNVPVVLNTAEIFNAATGNLTLGQSVNSGGNLITVTGTANTAIGGAVSGSGSLFKQGGGSLTISANGAWAGAGASSGGFSGPLIAQAGTTTFNNASVNSVNGEMVIGGVVANGGAGNNAKVVVDGSALNVNSWFSVGRGNGVGGVSSDLVLTNSATVNAANMSCGYNGGNGANLPLTSVTLYNNSSVVLNGGLNIAESPGSVTTVTLNNTSSFTDNSTWGKSIGDLGSGTLNINDSSSMTLGNAVTYIGYRTGTGVVSVASSGVFRTAGELQVGGSDINGTGNNANGTFTMSGGNACVGALTLARGNYLDNGCSGTVTLNGGTMICTNDAILEFAGTGLGKLAINGGNFIIGPSATKWFNIGWYDSGNGEVDITSGNLYLENNSSIKFSHAGNSGANVINQGGGNVTFFSDAGTTVGGTGALDMNYGGGASQTYNLNGGTLTVPQIIASSASGSSTFNFNGGTLKPTASTATYLQGLSAAYVQSGGAIIDTFGKNITIAQTLQDGGGGLAKLGAGTLTLSGGYSYSGPTVVQAGTLALDASQSSSASALTVSNATLSLSLNNGNSSINAGNVTFVGTNVLNLNFGTEAAPSSNPAINANSYAVINTGTNTINVTGPYLTVGEYQVINTGGAVPTNNFKLGTLPSGVVAVLTNSGASLDLLVTASGQSLTWFGADNSGNPFTTWDIGTSSNWNSGNAKYLQYSGNSYGDNVTFDDSAYNSSDTSISLNATVVPLSVTFNNSSYGYSLTGLGGIGGTTSVVKTNSGFVYLATTNTYTGATIISGGTLAVANDKALGANGSGVTLLGGTLQFSNSTTSARSLTVVSNSTINVAANAIAQLSGAVSSDVNLTKNGPGTLTLAGTSTTVALTVGGEPGDSLLNISGTLNTSNLFVGNVSGANAAVTQTGGTANINGGSGDNLSIGNWDGSYGYFKAAGGIMNVNGINIGGEENPNTWPPVGGGDGLMEVNGETINNAGWITLARGGGPNNAILNVYSGSLTFGGGGLACNWNGNAATVTGSQTSIINILGGSVASTNQGVSFRTSGQTGILNLNGGLLSCAGVSGSGSVNFNGGTLQAAPSFGSPFLNVAGNVFVFGGGAKIDDGGQIVTFSQPFQAPSDSGVSSIVPSDGGSGYIAPPIVTLSGGSGSNATAIATISGGAITGITVTCPGTGYSPSDTLTVTYSNGGSSAVAPASTTVNLAPNISGGLTKLGSGTVTLDGINTYAGPTVVNAGTLAGNGTVTGALTNKATLAAGDAGTGTLTVNGNLTLKTGSTNVFFVNGSTPASSSVAAGANVTYGGVLKIVPSGTFTAGQQFQLFSGTGATNTGNFASFAGSPGAGLAFSFTNGVLSVVSTGPSGPATITNSISGGTMTLTWPVGQGWRLVSQTNSLSTGLNNAAWGTVPGVSDGSVIITIDPTKPTVFYRLMFP